MHRHSRNRWLGFGVLAAAAALIVAAPAHAAPTSDGDGSDRSSSDEVLKSTVNDDLVATAEALTDAGVVGPTAELSDLVAQLKLSETGDLEVWYFDGDLELSTKLTNILASVDSAPLNIVPVPVNFNPEEVNELARQVSEQGHPSLRALGVTTVNSVEVDSETGRITVFSDDPVSGVARGEQLPFDLESGGEVEFQSRQFDSAPFSGGASLTYSTG